MVHKEGDDLQIKQVEFNTIASSFGGLSAQTSRLHQYLAQNEYPLLTEPVPGAAAAGQPLDLPANESARGLAAGLKAAFAAYGPSKLGHPTCVVFLVQDGERNVFDQRHLEYAVQEGTPRIPVFRLPFSDVLARTSVDPAGRQLLYHLPHAPSRVYEVAVAYLRAGYGPADYPDAAAWEARHRLERSAAIACPTILTQLAGMKKVQQVLATPPTDPTDGQTVPVPDPVPGPVPAALARFVTPADRQAALLRTFTNIFPLDGTPAGLAARRLATDPAACLRHVMKPQREGGGNNVYRAAIPAHLAALPDAHWSSFILMELITPPPLANLILRHGALEQGGVICELGVYGTCLWDRRPGGPVVHNAEAGYLLRTKGDQSEEGGVAAGYGCMDSVCLV